MRHHDIAGLRVNQQRQHPAGADPSAAEQIILVRAAPANLPPPPAGRVEWRLYDFGIAFLGSMKGLGTTRASRSPQGVAMVSLVPSSAAGTGSIA